MNKITLAGCVMLDGEGKILLMHRNTPRRVQWELPGGKIEADEEPKETARREIMEELGVDVSIVRKLGEKNFQQDGNEMGYMWFLATITQGVPTLVEKGFDNLGYFSWEELQSKPALSANAKNLVEAYFKDDLKL